MKTQSMAPINKAKMVDATKTRPALPCNSLNFDQVTLVVSSDQDSVI